jgi:hypothetical protein
MQCGERQLHFRLHPGDANYVARRRLPVQVLQQHRLAHTWFARKYQRPALTGANGFDDPVENGALGVTVNKLHRRVQQSKPAGILPAVR